MIRGTYWLRVKGKRLLIILVVVTICALLLVMDAAHLSHMSLLSSLFYGFSALIALAFLAVGAFVWLYARNRVVAFVLLSFSCTAMIPFAAETAALSGNQFFAKLSSVCASLALMLCAILLLLFPRNYLGISSSARVECLPKFSSLRRSIMLMRCYTCFIFAYGVLAGFFSLLIPGSSSALNWRVEVASIYYIVVLVGILLTIVVSYYQSSLRERQQLRLFVIGVVLAIVPFLFLTVLPEIINPNAPLVDPQLSTLSVLLLPLSLGYSILRYQLLVLDAYVRRAIAWLMGIVFLAVLCYLIVTWSSFLLKGTITQTVIVVAALSATLAPCTWWVAKIITDRLFFDELRHYRRIIDATNLPLDRAMNVAEAARLFTLAVTQTFGISHVCLFVLNEGAGAFDIAPPLRADLEDEDRWQMLHSLLRELKSSNQEYRNSLVKQQPAIERIATAQRPLLLSEAAETKRVPRGLDSYFVTASPGDNDPLLVPVRAQGRMIGLLVLGEREDQQPYAGPDFGVIQLLLARFSALLETARLYARANEHAELLNNLYRASTMSGTTFQSVEEVASIYASVAASATLASAELWLYDKKKNVLSSITAVGSGPYLTNLDKLRPVQELDWHSWFYEGRTHEQTEQNARSASPPCLVQKISDFPYAWLPLQDAEQRMGLLTLTYAQPHFFLTEEMHVLEMFAVQCASALANANMTMELRQAYERQKELDQLKDQFISTASHELRTPLTAVQGYIELLGEYNATLGESRRADFITKARLGCDELVLLVGNIMDASRVKIEAENVQLQAISLHESVMHVAEILDGVIRREQRVFQVDIPPALQVMADDLRLRQVLLNLISNALKYSPPGSTIELTSEALPAYITVRLRDYGLGVPPDDQKRLFERFMRLERDINSPSRGAGLGLYICKQLVEAMGGRIWVESSGREGDGSVFAFTLRRVEQRKLTGTSGSHSDVSLPL